MKLKLPLNAVIGVAGVALLVTVGYTNFSRPMRTPPAATAGHCSPEQIRQVVAPVERAILSANCNKLALAAH